MICSHKKGLKLKLLSIIIASKNDAENVIKTYNSLAQLLKYYDIQLIIQDCNGSSNLKNKINDDHVIILEEKDTCTSEACNMGVCHSESEYILFWGAGEIVMHDGFCRSMTLLMDKKPDILFNGMFQNGVAYVAAPEKIEAFMGCLTPAAMIKKDLFLKIGGLDERYMIANDYDLFVKLLKETKNYIINPECIVKFDLGGISNTAQALEGMLECELIRLREYGRNQAISAINIMTICKVYLKDLIRLK